MNFEATRI